MDEVNLEGDFQHPEMGGEDGFVYNKRKKSLIGGHSDNNEILTTPKNEDLGHLIPMSQYPTVIKVSRHNTNTEVAVKDDKIQEQMKELEMRKAMNEELALKLNLDGDTGILLSPVDEALLQNTLELNMKQQKVFYRNPNVDLYMTNIKKKMQATTTKGIVSSAIDKQRAKSRQFSMQERR